MRSALIALFLIAACAKKNAAGDKCKVTSDCQSGLFCVASVCKANIGSGTQCTAPTDCKPQETCAEGKCGELGCDSTHACNDGCCNAGQCATNSACPGGMKCGADGVCPARCDSASKGAGCNAGCCDSGSGVCGDGTADSACGASGGACVNCGSGASCASQVCVCSDTACTGPTQVCAGGACADCSTTPCSGNAPFCDASGSHMCQPCAIAPVGFCNGATPYCNFVTDPGACSATPDSSEACALADPTSPILISNGQCGCNADTLCPNGFLCDTGKGICKTACESAATDCQTGAHCDCADAACATTDCGAACTGCAFTNDNGTTCDNTHWVNLGVQTPETCNGTMACDGFGAVDLFGDCKPANGQSCTITDNETGGGYETACASSICDFSNAAGTSAVCAPIVCTGCQYWDGVSPTCTNVTSGDTTTTCTGSDYCDGNGTCLLANDEACASDAQCQSTVCVVVGQGPKKQCGTHSCGPCTISGDPDCVEGKGSFCIVCGFDHDYINSGSTCGGTNVCDGNGNCADPGTCGCNDCSATGVCDGPFNSCSPGAGEFSAPACEQFIFWGTYGPFCVCVFGPPASACTLDSQCYDGTCSVAGDTECD